MNACFTQPNNESTNEWKNQRPTSEQDKNERMPSCMKCTKYAIHIHVCVHVCIPVYIYIYKCVAPPPCSPNNTILWQERSANLEASGTMLFLCHQFTDQKDHEKSGSRQVGAVSKQPPTVTSLPIPFSYKCMHKGKWGGDFVQREREVK